jgi:hypothetical protein
MAVGESSGAARLLLPLWLLLLWLLLLLLLLLLARNGLCGRCCASGGLRRLSG